MPLLLVFARVILAFVFLMAGLAKLFDREGTSKAIVDFGFRNRVAGPIAMSLPYAELAIAFLLIPLRSAWAGAVGAFTLLLAFIVVIGVNIAQGRKPDCHCFGQIHTEPIGWRTLARNGLLTGCAGLIVFVGRTSPGVSAVGWVHDLTPMLALGLLAGMILGVALAVEGWLLLNLTRQNGRLLLRIEDLEKRLGVPVMSQKPVPAPIHVGLSVGAPAPAFELPILSGEMLSLDVLRRDRLPVLLIFSDPNCGPCSALLPEINSWQQDFAGQIVIAVVSRGDAKANRAKVDQHKLKNILLQRDREVAEQYQANGTPVAVLVRADGTIGSRVVTGAEAIKELVMRTTALGWGLSSNGNGRKLPVASPQMGLAIGEPAPPINLPDLVGKTVTLEDFKGTKTLLLFWNPGCGYCQRMLEDLKAWEDDLPQSAPQLVLVSTGGAEANLAMGLRSQVLLDASFRVGNSFQATGTPSAVLLDEGGKIASELIVGAPGVLALAGMREVRPTIAVRSVVSVQSQAN